MTEANDIEIDERCRPFEEDLSAWIDGEVAQERLAVLRAHVWSCPACTRRIAALRAIDVGLGSAAEARAAVDEARLAQVRRNVDAAIHGGGDERPAAQRAPLRKRRWLAPLVAGSLSAAAAATLVLLVRPAPPAATLADRGRDRAVAATEPSAPPAAASLPEARLAAQTTADAFANSGASAAAEAEVDAAPPVPPAAAGPMDLDSARELEMIERIAAMSDDERVQFERKLEVWRSLPADEQQRLRVRWQRGAATR